MLDYDDMALAFGRAARGAGVSYAFIGGFAVIVWGITRTTYDVDVLVKLAPERTAHFVESLSREGLRASEHDVRASLADRSHLTIFDAADLANVVHVDVKLALTPQELAQVEAAVQITVRGEPLWVARPEDTVAFKLKFGSPQDWKDARGILAKQRGRLDMERLRRFAGTLGVEADLERVMEEADR